MKRFKKCNYINIVKDVQNTLNSKVCVISAVLNCIMKNDKIDKIFHVCMNESMNCEKLKMSWKGTNYKLEATSPVLQQQKKHANVILSIYCNAIS